MSKERELVKLKERMENHETRINQLEGKLESLKERLENECGCSTVKEGNSTHKKMEKDLQQMELDFDEKQEEIEGEVNEWKGC